MRKILFAALVVVFAFFVFSKVGAQSYSCSSSLVGLLGSGCHYMYSNSSGQYIYCNTEMTQSAKEGDTAATSGCSYSGTTSGSTSTTTGSSCSTPSTCYDSAICASSGWYWYSSGCWSSPQSTTSGTTTSYSPCSSALQTLLGTGCHWMYTDTDSRSIYCNTEMNKSAHEGDTATTGTCTSPSGSTYTYSTSTTTSSTSCSSGYYWYAPSDGSTGYCKSSGGGCGSYTTQSTCTAVTSCKWYQSASTATGSSYCYYESSGTTSSACASNQYWNGSACVTSTVNYTASASVYSPTGLSASGSGSGNVTVSWAPTTGATKYVIYRKLEGSSWSYLTSLTTTTYLDGGALAGTHEYYVQACSDTGGCSPDAGLRVTVTASSVSSTTFTPSGNNYTYTSGSYTAPTYTYSQNTSYAGDENSCPGFAYSRWDKAGKRYCQLNNEKKCDYNHPSYLTNGANYKVENCPAEEVYTYTAQTSSACPSGVSSLLGTGCHQMYTDSSGNPVYCDSDMKRSMKATDTVAGDGCAGSYYNASTYTYAGDANSCPGFAYSRWDKTGTRYCQLNSEKKCDYKYPSYTTNGANYKVESCPLEDSSTYNTYTYTPPSSSCPSGVLSVLGTGCHQMYTDSSGKAIYCDSGMVRSMKDGDASAKDGCSYTYTGNSNWVSHDWKFTDGTQNSFILNRTDSEYTNFIAGVDAQCAKISKNKFGWNSEAGNDSATNWQKFGIPDCSGTVTAATCPSGQYWNGASCVLTTITATCSANYHYMSDYTGGSGGYCMSDNNSSTCQPLSGGATYTCGTKAIDTTTSQYKDWKKVDWGTGGSSYVPTTVTQTVIDATKAYLAKECPAATYYSYENSSDTSRPNPGVPSCPSTYTWTNSTSTTSSSCPSGYHYMGGGYSGYSTSYCMADSSPNTCQPTGGGATYTCPGYTTATTTAAIYPFTFSSSKKICLNYQECFDYCKTTPGSGTGDPSTCELYFPGSTAYVSPVLKDTTPPYLDYSKTFPKYGETNIPVTSKIHIEFNEPIDDANIFGETKFFTLEEGNATTFFGSLIQNSRKFLAQLVGTSSSNTILGKVLIQGTMSFSGDGFDFTPKESLKSKTTYTWRALTGIKDKFGNKTTAEYSSTFTTASSGLFAKGIGKISGTVTDGKGNPVNGAYLNIGDSSYTFWRSTQTNASGTYAFADVPEGKYKISLNSPSTKTSLIAPSETSVTVDDGKTTTKNLAFLSSNKLIKGSIKTSDGKAITDAQISAYRQNGPGWTQTESNVSGEFAITVSGGSWQLSAWPRNYEKSSWTYDNQPVTVTFADDSADETKSVEMTMKVQNSTVKGKVTYEDGRIPRTYDVSINISSLGRSFPVSQLASDGSFSVKVTAGTYEVTVWASDQSIKVAPKSITVLESETKDLGTIKLTKSTEKIIAKVTNTEGKAIPNAWVNAYQSTENAYSSYGGDKSGVSSSYIGPSGGYASGQTGEDGTVTLSVSPGKWSVQSYGDSTASYTNTNPPLTVTIAEKETKNVTIKVGTIDATITGFVKDDKGVIVDDFYGYVYAEDYAKNSSDTAYSFYSGGGSGGSVSRGTFNFKIAAGNYKLKLNSSQNALWTSDKIISVTVGKGETKSVDVTVRKNNSYITGALVDSRGVAIKGISARVFATGEGGAWQESYVDSATGEYSIKVTSGTWFLGASLYNYGYYGSATKEKYSYSAQDIKVSVGEGKTTKQNITLTSSDATVKGTVKKADGKTMPYVWVSVSARSYDSKEKIAAVSEGYYSFSEGAQTDKDGAFSVTVPEGTYFVRVYAPPEAGVINPKEEKVGIKSGETKTVALEFRKADLSITGVTYVENLAKETFVFGWSESGGYIETRSGADGVYTLKVGQNETWRVAAKSNYQNNYYKSYEVTLKTGETGTITQDLVLTAEKKLPPPVTKAVETDKPSVVSTNDGTKITVPANSVGSTGSATVTVSPTAELPEQGTSKVVGTGYDVNVYDAVGKEVTKLNTELTITIPYEPTELKDAGIEPKDLKIAYYDEATAIWMELTASAVNEAEHTVTAVVSHLTRFALVAAADTIPPVAPTKIEAKALGSGKVKISWINPLKDFKHTKVYRSEKEGELGALRAAEIKEKEFTDDEGLKDGVTYYYTVRAVDPAGNESQNTEQTKIKSSGTSIKTSALLKTTKKTTEQKSSTATSTTVTSAKSIGKNLSAGMKGDEVKLMQEVLINEGLLAKGSASGYFGNLTKQAVIKFQEKYADEILKPVGLTKGNGFLGTGTRAKINKLIK